MFARDDVRIGGVFQFTRAKNATNFFGHFNQAGEVFFGLSKNFLAPKISVAMLHSALGEVWVSE